jgi:hypothetical protein
MRCLVAASLAALLGTAGCAHGEPPAPDASPSIAAPELPAPSTSGAAPSPSSSTSTSTGNATATPTPSASVDPATLPQTHDRPVASGPAFEARVAALWSAIVADDPQQAAAFFFPVAAYQQVKDIPDPASDWKHRLFAAYAHDIHALHARLGADANQAKLVSFDVPDGRARWVDPGEEYNKIGYYRVFGTRLRYTNGTESYAFEVKSLISWRGEWFIVHLSAIK